MTVIDARRPVHLFVLVGLSIGTYATSLAGVAALQSRADAALDATRRPIGDVAATTADQHARLESAVDEAARRYQLLTDRYDRLAPAIGALETSLTELAARSNEISDTVASMPTRIALPKAPRLPTYRAPRPVTHATTGGSG